MLKDYEDKFRDYFLKDNNISFPGTRNSVIRKRSIDEESLGITEAQSIRSR